MSSGYFAFISYSRKDKKAARYLQHKLEYFNYPSRLVDDSHKPDNPKYIRKIFRDTSDLEFTGNDFKVAIRQHIAESRYLVVLCSPASQKSTWVKEEIEIFLQTHDNNLELIFPIILSGEAPDCLPEPLRIPEFCNRNIPTMVPDDDDSVRSKKDGWERGFLGLVSALLNVSLAKISDRFQEAKQAMLRRIIFGTLAALAVTSGLTVWALIAEFKAKAAEAKAVRAEMVARHKAKVAEESLAFIKDAFSAADATKSGDKDMTLLDFARQTSARLDQMTVPEVKLKVAEIVLPLLGNMGNPVTALAQLLPLLPEASSPTVNWVLA